MASNRKRPEMQPQRGVRDPLTGEWHGGLHRLQHMPGVVVMLVRDWDPARRDLPPKPCPTRIHSRTVEGYLGGHAFSQEAAHYWKSPLTAPRPLSYAESHWWTPDWAERELRAFFPAEAVDIVLSVRRDGVSWDEAMIGASMAQADVRWHMRRMARHVRKILRSERAA